MPPVRSRCATVAVHRASPAIDVVRLAASVVAMTALGGRAAAQDRPPPRDSTAHAHAGQASKHAWRLSGEATLAVTRQSRGASEGPLTEVFLTRPVVAAHGSFWNGGVAVVAELNFEGLTMPRGEITPGIYGESYYDRRHPHALVHDVVLSATRRRNRVDASLSAGRGFASFGTDDPMSRPFLKFPVNHHLAQLLERVVVIGAAHTRLGGTASVTAEASVFNGDDPVGPFAPPEWERLGDSWSARLTATPVATPRAHVEVQLSHARVESPEVVAGWGLDQRKWSTSARFASTSSRRPYLLVEWAMTDSYSASFRTFRLSTALAEGAVRLGATELGARVERTERPEEERALNPYRTLRPPHDLSINGITRWAVASVRVAYPLLTTAGFGSGVFSEVSYARPRARLSPTAFEPEQFYGTSAIWAFSAGVRVGVGMAHPRMGRYGAAAGEGHACGMHCTAVAVSLGRGNADVESEANK